MGLALLGEPDLVTVLGNFLYKYSYEIDALNWLNSFKKGKKSLAGGLFYPNRTAFLPGDVPATRYNIYGTLFSNVEERFKPRWDPCNPGGKP